MPDHLEVWLAVRESVPWNDVVADLGGPVRATHDGYLRHVHGNERLAGLVLLFVLLRERVELDEVTPILTTIRRADDADGAADLARLVYGIAAATRRRHLQESAQANGM